MYLETKRYLFNIDRHTPDYDQMIKATKSKHGTLTTTKQSNNNKQIIKPTTQTNIVFELFRKDDKI